MKTPAAAMPRRAQRGVSSLLVLALLVTLGSLTVHAVGLVTSALGDDSRALAQARAAEAAAAGVEWGRYRVRVAPLPLCTAAQSITTLPGALQPFTVTVRCSVSGPYSEGAGPLRRYRVAATACNQPAGGACPNPALPGANYVQHSAVANLER